MTFRITNAHTQCGRNANPPELRQEQRGVKLPLCLPMVNNRLMVFTHVAPETWTIPATRALAPLSTHVAHHTEERERSPFGLQSQCLRGLFRHRFDAQLGCGTDVADICANLEKIRTTIYDPCTLRLVERGEVATLQRHP